jgi:glycosyltransferase involved in cell wall biosynthesis
MNAKMQHSRKWYTCTPVRFTGDHTFFSRDSGLLCKGFQEIGVACKAIMPGPAMDTDQVADLIRTDYANLEDPAWWRTLEAEGVVFYGWGSGKYVKIVRAIKEAGIILVTHMDTAGMLGILNGPREFAGTLWRVCLGEANSTLAGICRFVLRLAYGSTIGFIRNDLGRAQHLKQANLIGAITPIAMERIRKVCRVYGGEALAKRVQLVPHPNASYMRYDAAIPKERLVVAVGRWDDAKVKGTDLLLQTSKIAVERDPELKIEIYGRPNPAMTQWHAGLPNNLQARIQIKGVVPNTEITQGLQRAKISLCTSLREGYHTVSAEAHCCGCSTVGPDVPEIPSMKWFAAEPYGRMSTRDAASMANAIEVEMTAWDKGRREPNQISRYWTEQLHAPRVAEQILALSKTAEQ